MRVPIFVCGLAVAMVVLAASPSAAAPQEEPHPTWSVSAESDELAAADYGCRGTANAPARATDQYGNAGIGYDAKQDCFGEFDIHRVCVKLQERDYYGTFYDRTSFFCSRETVAARAYAGRFVSCVQAGVGLFRTYAQGYVRVDGVQIAPSPGTSAGSNLCSGY